MTKRTVTLRIMIGILSKPAYICLVYMYLYELGFPDLPPFFFCSSPGRFQGRPRLFSQLYGGVLMTMLMLSSAWNAGEPISTPHIK